MKNERFSRGLWLFPVLLALIINLNVLANGFGWDDEKIIPNLKVPERWWNVVVPPEAAVASLKTSKPYYRPLISISYRLDKKIWGDELFGFHLSVLIAHLVNTGLIFFLARGLVKGTSEPLSLLPLVAASLFAAHPVHAEAVAWIAGRNDVLCTTLMLSSLLFYFRFHQTGNRMVFGLSMASFFLALLSKETAVGLLILFPLYQYLVQSTQCAVTPTLTLPTHHRSLCLWQRIGIPMLIPLAILGGYFWMRAAKIASPYGGTSLPERISSSSIGEMISVAGLYLKMMLFPYPHQPFIAAVPLSHAFLILSGLVLVLVVSGMIFALIRREVLLGMGLAWMLVTLAPAVAVAVLDLAATPAAERYAYAASAGFLIISVWLILKGLERLLAVTAWPQRPVWITTALLFFAIVTAWGWESWNRNAVWKSPVTFWAAAASSSEAGYPHRELGVYYVRLRQHTEAEEHYLRAIAIDEKVLGPQHPDVAKSLHNLANLYRIQGRYTEAESLYRNALTIREKALGPAHPDVAISLNNLGELYRMQGQYTEAEPLYRDSVAILEKALGPAHSYVATGLNNLGELYRAQGRYTEAEPLYRRAIAIREKALGPEHPYIATSLNNLGELYRAQGRYAEAEPVYQRSLAIREKALGPDHPKVAKGLHNLAVLYRGQARYVEAEPLYLRALSVWEKTLGPSHPDRVVTLESYATMLQMAGRDSEAAEWKKDAEDIRRGVSP